MADQQNRMIANPDGSMDVYQEAPPQVLPSGREDGQTEREWFENLAPQIDDDLLKEKAGSIIALVASDISKREKWMEGVDAGLMILSEDGGVAEEDENRRERNLSIIKHPILAETATLFASTATGEMIPREGPVKIKVVGQADDVITEQSDKLRKFLNHLLVDTIGYKKDTDRLLTLLPLLGHMFRRVWWDPVKMQPQMKTILPHDIIVNPQAKSLTDAARICWRYDLTLNEFNKLAEAGWFEPIDELRDSGFDTDIFKTHEKMEKVTGVDKSVSDFLGNDQPITLYEVHANVDFEGLDGMEKENDDKVVPPYIITIEASTQQIVSVRRNWKRNDGTKTKIEHFVDYQFHPGPEFWGLGLYHFVGGFYRGATGATRSLLDAATFQNMPGGFILGSLKDGVGQDVSINYGEYTPIHFSGDDIRNLILPHNFGEPSPVMRELLDYFVESVRRFAGATDIDTGNINANSPVGTTAMLMEKASVRARAIQHRLWSSQDTEFKILVRLIKENMRGSIRFQQHGESLMILQQDFQGVTILPVADPTVSSKADRVAKTQAILQAKELLPGQFDERAIAKRMLQDFEFDNPDLMLAQEQSVPSADPLTENANITQGKPAGTEITDDHDNHLAVHIKAFQNPTTLAMMQQSETVPLMMVHIFEHHAHKVKLEVVQFLQQQMGVELPVEAFYEQMNPEQKNQVAMLTAQVLAVNPEIGRLPELEQLVQDPVQQEQAAMVAAQRQALEQEEARKEQDFQAQLRRDDLKNQQQLQFTEDQNRIKIESAVALAEIAIRKEIDKEMLAEREGAAEQRRKDAETIAEIQRERDKLQVELQAIRQKAAAQPRPRPAQ